MKCWDTINGWEAVVESLPGHINVNNNNEESSQGLMQVWTCRGDTTTAPSVYCREDEWSSLYRERHRSSEIPAFICHVIKLSHICTKHLKTSSWVQGNKSFINLTIHRFIYKTYWIIQISCIHKPNDHMWNMQQHHCLHRNCFHGFMFSSSI